MCFSGEAVSPISTLSGMLRANKIVSHMHLELIYVPKRTVNHVQFLSIIFHYLHLYTNELVPGEWKKWYVNQKSY